MTTTPKREERDRSIRVARAAGASVGDLAAKFDLDPRQVGRILRKPPDAAAPPPVLAPSVLSPSVVDLVDRPDRLAAFALEALVTSVSTGVTLCGSRNASVQIAAARSVPHAVVTLLGVLDDLGLAPPTARTWRFLNDLPATIGAIGDAVDEAGLDREDVTNRIVAALDHQDAERLSARVTEELMSS